MAADGSKGEHKVVIATLSIDQLLFLEYHTWYYYSFARNKYTTMDSSSFAPTIVTTFSPLSSPIATAGGREWNSSSLPPPPSSSLTSRFSTPTNQYISSTRVCPGAPLPVEEESPGSYHHCHPSYPPTAPIKKKKSRSRIFDNDGNNNHNNSILSPKESREEDDEGKGRMLRRFQPRRLLFDDDNNDDNDDDDDDYHQDNNNHINGGYDVGATTDAAPAPAADTAILPPQQKKNRYDRYRDHDHDHQSHRRTHIGERNDEAQEFLQRQQHHQLSSSALTAILLGNTPAAAAAAATSSGSTITPCNNNTNDEYDNANNNHHIPIQQGRRRSKGVGSTLFTGTAHRHQNGSRRLSRNHLDNDNNSHSRHGANYKSNRW